jgi:hypothetical protein
MLYDRFEQNNFRGRKHHYYLDCFKLHEPHQVPSPHVALVVVLLLQTQLFGQLEPKELVMQGNLQILT